MHTITDLAGSTIEVTDLEAAILQAETFKSFRHADRAYARLDHTLYLYWSDMLEKLMALKNPTDGNAR